VQLTRDIFGAVVEHRGRPAKFRRDVEIAVGVRLECDVVMEDPVGSAAQESGPGIWNFELLLLGKALRWPLIYSCLDD